ncbi:hypothetical protein A1O3_02573 [Capronia epimyces CBS 606.96]|uniref:Arginine N-methyltransferase 2 n=1 Tax=Capronia epimyces CBS 606.96 TaxID=1182542 RepID=W9YJT8_9EURO|nr:uncharacterized protein A1O3_02573 [Capronia epimyces CBS 606.96]EXJ89506.1 hypothetical protein A1O3_02573 [Capronia epimyces CBS 606.96]
MASPPTAGTDGQSLEEHIQEIMRASSKHDIERLEKCIKEYSFPECKAVDVQEPTTGHSPLHASIASCKPAVNGSGTEQEQEHETTDVEASGVDTVRFLLENGAIWNQVDDNNETPGCLAYRLGLTSLYQLMVDAGVRAEMLLSRLEEYEKLDDDEGDDADNGMGTASPQAEPEEQDESLAVSTAQAQAQAQDVSSSVYLSSALALSSDKLLDEQQNGVMMAWEGGIMQRSADALLSEPGMQILNIGFGMGIIDSCIQNHVNKPASHHIVEAHPAVLTEMRDKGWMNKANVVVHSGKWQDILPQLVAEGEVFDAIYFDTFAESYADFRDFFSEQVIGLLNERGKWSFFNGMGADRQISYDVYQRVVEMDLFESGFDVEWEDVTLPDLDHEWEGVRRKYWNVHSYRLPVCKFMD